MNVFVLCTGRSGSVTFIQACAHISNFSAAHESLSGRLAEARFAYPANHIEADNRLSWLLGRLDRHYGRDAFYVHLQRDRQKTAESFARRADKGIMKAYRSPGVLMGLREPDPMALALDYVDTVTTNIDLFLRDKPHQMHFDLEGAATCFPEFCRRIDAEVDIQRALHEFTICHNASAGSAVPGG